MLSQGADDHAVTFCRTDAELAGAAAEYLLGSILRGGAGVVVADRDHARLIGQRLADAGIDLATAGASGAYFVLDAAETMSQFLVSGWPDPAAFWRAISPVIARAARRQREVRVFGDMVSPLWLAGRFSAAIDVEALWTELARQHGFSLLCAYPETASAADPDADDRLALILAAHTRQVPLR